MLCTATTTVFTVLANVKSACRLLIIDNFVDFVHAQLDECKQKFKFYLHAHTRGVSECTVLCMYIFPCKCQMWENPLNVPLKIDAGRRPLHCGKFRRLRPQKYKPKIREPTQRKSTKINNQNKCKTKANNKSWNNSSENARTFCNQTEKPGAGQVDKGAWGWRWKNRAKKGVYWK